MTEDFPTFDLPAKTIVGWLPEIKSFGLAADFTNSVLFIFILFLLLSEV